jgi:methionyl-tRNA synthetase
MPDPFYITTAISYPNGAPHIGHAYEAIATDAIARYQRMTGREVLFTTGTDEHGLKMAQAARVRDITPLALADEMSSQFKRMDEVLNISFDRFIRTTEPAHYEASQAIWRAMVAKGDIYLGRYEGWYSVRDEAFYGEEELVEGEDGAKLSPQNTPVEWTVEESWFFKLSAYADKLIDLYEKLPDFIRPEGRRNEVMSFVKGGLSDLSVSRTSFDWGVPVPDAAGHVMYVWVDALTNYLTSTGYPDRTGPLAKFWESGATHIIGKDIVRFHAVYWPAFLMSADLPLPKQVFGHGFLLNRGEKMSKSVGNVVDPIGMAETYGVDQLRYFLLREVSFGQDGSYSHEAIVTRSNADLANGLGNLAQRCLSIIAKNCGGVLPEPGSEPDTLLPILETVAERMGEAMADLALHRALEVIWEGVAEANRYFADRAPWTLRKTDPAEADGVLYRTAEAIRQLAILVRWAIPASADALLDQLAQPADGRDFAALATPLAPGTVLPTPQGVFPRWIEPA